MSHITLSRTNLKALLAKLDIVAGGGQSACAIIKYKIANDPGGQSMDACRVQAIEDDDYYINRPPGDLHPDTEAKMNEK